MARAKKPKKPSTPKAPKKPAPEMGIGDFMRDQFTERKDEGTKPAKPGPKSAG